MLGLVKPAEAATELRVSVNTVYAWIHSGTIPSVRMGGLYRIRREDLNALTAGELAAVPSVPVTNTAALAELGVGAAAPAPARPAPHPNAGWL
jgi:excisionase family DNA binding protein